MTLQETAIIFRSLRAKKGLTGDEVYELTGIPQGTLSNWENGHGRPTVSSFLSLCHLYGVTDIYATFGETPPDAEDAVPSPFGKESQVLDAYRKADLATKRMIEKMLDIPADTVSEKNA